jgi:hypothetical protein
MRRVVPALLAAFEDKDERTRFWAAYALKRIDRDCTAQRGIK